MLETRDTIELTPDAIMRGYRSCRTAVRNHFREMSWMMMNLPGDRRKGLEALLTHLIRTLDFLDLESPNGMPLDVWCETRDDLGDGLNGQCTSVELAALHDACHQFDVPRQYLFDMLDGVDGWTRRPHIDSFDELLVLSYRLGGAPMAAAVPVLGFVKPDYEIPAIRCGQAFVLTQVIANCVTNLREQRNLIPAIDFRECEVDLPRLRLRQNGPGVGFLVRLYCSRIEALLKEGLELLPFLDFDGRRTMTSMIAWHWRMVARMKLVPESILDPNGVLDKREKRILKARHMLGLERHLPWMSQQEANTGH